jgi:hypothetical protein
MHTIAALPEEAMNCILFTALHLFGAMERQLLHVTITIWHMFHRCAWCAAQVASTLIALFGFGGYAPPPESVQPCSLCDNSLGYHPTFWPSGCVPVAGTEGGFTASVIGCTYYVVVAWIW